MNHGLDTDTQVFFYEQEFYVLSNFSAFQIKGRVFTFPTSEHAYQWSKFCPRSSLYHESNTAVQIRQAPSAHEAFRLAGLHANQRRKDWSEVKVDIMRSILYAKVNQHEYVRRKLLETGDRELVENSWRDDFWGWGQTGQARTCWASCGWRCAKRSDKRKLY